MIPHIHTFTLFEFISIPYKNGHQKIDRGQIKSREYSITLLQPYSEIITALFRENYLVITRKNIVITRYLSRYYGKRSRNYEIVIS